MSVQIENALELMEQLKEVQRIRYDYFKHLTTLSTGTILIIIAFLEKIFTDPRGTVFALISIIAFVFCLVASLWTLPRLGNVIMEIIRVKFNLTKGENEALPAFKKLNKSYRRTKIFYWITCASFLIGIIAFLVFAGINFIDC